MKFKSKEVDLFDLWGNRVSKVEVQVNSLISSKSPNTPIFDPAELPDEYPQGGYVLGTDGFLYFFKDDQWYKCGCLGCFDGLGPGVQIGPDINITSHDYGAGAFSPYIIKGPDGQPWVTWIEKGSDVLNYGPYVARWNGSSWVQLPGPGPDGELSAFYDIYGGSGSTDSTCSLPGSNSGAGQVITDVTFGPIASDGTNTYVFFGHNYVYPWTRLVAGNCIQDAQAGNNLVGVVARWNGSSWIMTEINSSSAVANGQVAAQAHTAILRASLAAVGRPIVATDTYFFDAPSNTYTRTFEIVQQNSLDGPFSMIGGAPIIDPFDISFPGGDYTLQFRMQLDSRGYPTMIIERGDNIVLEAWTWNGSSWITTQMDFTSVFGLDPVEQGIFWFDMSPFYIRTNGDERSVIGITSAVAGGWKIYLMEYNPLDQTWGTLYGLSPDDVSSGITPSTLFLPMAPESSMKNVFAIALGEEWANFTTDCSPPQFVSGGQFLSGRYVDSTYLDDQFIYSIYPRGKDTEVWRYPIERCIQPCPGPFVGSDSFAGATPLSMVDGFGTVYGNNEDATAETNDPISDVFGYGGGKSLWYKWTALDDGTATFTTSDAPFVMDSINDTLMVVYTGATITGLSVVDSDDDSGPGNYARCQFTAVAGITYYIEIDGFNGLAFGDPSYDVNETARGPFLLNFNLV